MRRFLLNYPAGTAREAFAGVAAIGCEMWEEGPVALCWIQPRSSPGWYDRLEEVQTLCPALGTELVLVDSDPGTYFSQIYHVYQGRPLIDLAPALPEGSPPPASPIRPAAQSA